jgi:hypothetical protein
MDGTWGRRCGGGAGTRSGLHDEVLGSVVQASAPSKQQKEGAIQGSSATLRYVTAAGRKEAAEEAPHHTRLLLLVRGAAGVGDGGATGQGPRA